MTNDPHSQAGILAINEAFFETELELDYQSRI
jgi:hypothetical protein